MDLRIVWVAVIFACFVVNPFCISAFTMDFFQAFLFSFKIYLQTHGYFPVG